MGRKIKTQMTQEEINQRYRQLQEKVKYIKPKLQQVIDDIEEPYKKNREDRIKSNSYLQLRKQLGHLTPSFIIHEYLAIHQKKSKLSSAQRQLIIGIWQKAVKMTTPQ
jgi:DNA helicase IV